jgi:hypothetical protein
VTFINGEEARASLAHLYDEIAANSRQALGQAAALALQVARSTTKFKDGPDRELRSSLTRGERGPFHIFVQAGARHALFVEEDTKPHVIRAKLGRGAKGPAAPGQSRGGSGSGLLVFQIAGRWISKPFVKHPGTTGTHFMRDARDQAETALVRFIEIGVDRAAHT